VFLFIGLGGVKGSDGGEVEGKGGGVGVCKEILV
jgi:hypothetical protein